MNENQLNDEVRFNPDSQEWESIELRKSSALDMTVDEVIPAIPLLWQTAIEFSTNSVRIRRAVPGARRGEDVNRAAWFVEFRTRSLDIDAPPKVWTPWLNEFTPHEFETPHVAARNVRAYLEANVDLGNRVVPRVSLLPRNLLNGKEE